MREVDACKPQHEIISRSAVHSHDRLVVLIPVRVIDALVNVEAALAMSSNAHNKQLAGARASWRVPQTSITPFNAARSVLVGLHGGHNG
jgi:hypothetical protein